MLVKAETDKHEPDPQMPSGLEQRADLAERKAMGFKVLQRVLENARLTYEEAEAVNLVLAHP